MRHWPIVLGALAFLQRCHTDQIHFLSRIIEILAKLDNPNRTHESVTDFSKNLNDDLRAMRIQALADPCLGPGSAECPLYAEVPALPTMANLRQATPLEWTTAHEAAFGTANEAHYKGRATAAAGCAIPSAPGPPRARHRHGVILAMAEGYDCNRVSLFLKSLRDAGSLARVVLFRSDAAAQPCFEILESCQHTTFEPINGFPSVKPEVRRYILALRYLVSLAQSEHWEGCLPVAVMDFKDAYFQADPFEVLSQLHAEVMLTEEGYDISKKKRLTLFNEPSGAGRLWLSACGRQILGRDLLREVGDMPILNSGVIVGRAQGMLKLLFVFAYAAEKMDLLASASSGQGLLNYIFYTGMLSRFGLTVKVLPPAASSFVHAVYYHPAKRNATAKYHPQRNPLVNVLDSPYAVVHMFDRWHILGLVEEWMEEYSRINYKGHSVGSPFCCNMTIHHANDNVECVPNPFRKRPDGSLFSCAKEIFCLSNATLRSVPNMDVFASWGWQLRDVTRVPCVALGKIPLGLPIGLKPSFVALR